MTPELRTSISQLRQRLISGDMAAHSVNQNLTKDGRTIVCEWHNTPLLDPDGRMIAMLSMAHDVTERRHAEEALRESEARYRSLISQVKDFAIFSTDERGLVTTWNEGCQQVLGYQEEEFLGLDSAVLYAAEHRSADLPEAQLRQAATTGTARIDHWLTAKGGRRFFAMGATTSLKDADGRLIGFSTVLRDVTQMKLRQDELAHQGESLERLVSERTTQLQETTERLRVSERMASLGTLSAGLGHDMGNLLLPLSVRLDLLLRADLPGELHEHVLGIQTCAQYLQRLSNGLRLLAVDPARARTNEATELGSWWSDVEMMLRGAIPRGIRFEHRVAATRRWVAMGRIGLTQAVFNLVQNAADALRDRGVGRITVSVEDERPSGRVRIRVADDGPGMTDEVRRRCLEPYFTTKARGVSTGMGLAFVHGLVTEVNGRVEIESVLGQGTTISLLMPPAHVDEGLSDSARRVAIVKMADARMRSFVSGELKTLGFEVRRRATEEDDVAVIVADSNRIAGLPKMLAVGGSVIVIGESAPGAVVDASVVVLGRNPPPDTIVRALRRAAHNADGLRTS